MVVEKKTNPDKPDQAALTMNNEIVSFSCKRKALPQE